MTFVRGGEVLAVEVLGRLGWQRMTKIVTQRLRRHVI